MAMTRLKKRPLLLVIIDGFGHSDRVEGNAVRQARTPNLDDIMRRFPHTLIEGSGARVGLPRGLMGNSEVGHMNIGAGRIVPLDITRIDAAIESGRFAENPVLQSAIDAGKNTALHLIGLVSDGGVHSSLDHLYALLDTAARRGVRRLFIHGFTDGRDAAPNSARNYLEPLIAHINKTGAGRIATLCGRYYSMDRDNRWDRIERAYRLLTAGEGAAFTDPLAGIAASYEFGISDEFIEPIVVVDDAGEPIGRVSSGDSVIFFNFRADRARQLTRAFSGLNFDGFERERIEELHFATFTQYDRAFNTPIIFPPVSLRNTLAEVFAANGVRNLRAAESEKYAHVTYFLNGGVEAEFPGERRLLIPSPEVAHYDERPEMSAYQLTDAVLNALALDQNDIIIVNYANADMVGHTGNLAAAVAAVETIDTVAGRLVEAVERAGGAAIITSDHGNVEQMIDPETGLNHTAHTSNPVPLILCDSQFRGRLRSDGALEDIAPTLLDLLGLPVPAEMTGRSLIVAQASGKSGRLG